MLEAVQVVVGGVGPLRPQNNRNFWPLFGARQSIRRLVGMGVSTAWGRVTNGVLSFVNPNKNSLTSKNKIENTNHKTKSKRKHEMKEGYYLKYNTISFRFIKNYAAHAGCRSDL